MGTNWACSKACGRLETKRYYGLTFSLMTEQQTSPFSPSKRVLSLAQNVPTLWTFWRVEMANLQTSKILAKMPQLTFWPKDSCKQRAIRGRQNHQKKRGVKITKNVVHFATIFWGAHRKLFSKVQKHDIFFPIKGANESCRNTDVSRNCCSVTARCGPFSFWLLCPWNCYKQNMTIAINLHRLSDTNLKNWA